MRGRSRPTLIFLEILCIGVLYTDNQAEVESYSIGIPCEIEVCRGIANKMWPAVGIKTKVNDLTSADLHPNVSGLVLPAPDA